MMKPFQEIHVDDVYEAVRALPFMPKTIVCNSPETEDLELAWDCVDSAIKRLIYEKGFKVGTNADKIITYKRTAIGWQLDPDCLIDCRPDYDKWRGHSLEFVLNILDEENQTP